MSPDQFTLADLLRVMQRLRDPDGGCPWDLEQDFRSIVPSTLEECYELAEAIEHGDFPHVAEELGDVLFQVVFYAQLGQEQQLFSFPEIVDTLVRKLVRRHPHVFASGEIEGRIDSSATVAQVKTSWEEIKQGERHARDQTSILDDVPTALPALPRAQKLQKRAARVNFDWPHTRAALDKVQEELNELREALDGGSQSHIEEELGDLLFSCVNVSRRVGLDAETTLRRASIKFEGRFRAMELLCGASGQSLGELDEQALDALWNRVKAGDTSPK
jgi:nucleoside triphosphate diphosphatase